MFPRDWQISKTVVTLLSIAVATVFLLAPALFGCGEDETGGKTAADGSASGVSGEAGGFAEIDPDSLLTSEESAGRRLLEPEYRDIDGDGQTEALLAAQGEGDNQLLDWYVYGIRDGQPVRLFARTGVVRGELSLDRPWIEEREALYEPGDPACCPSAFLVSRYSFENGSLVLMDRTKVPAM